MADRFHIEKEIKGLIFDLDGTLIDSMPLHMQAWKDACSVYGMDMSSEFLKSFTGSPGNIIAKAIIKKYGFEESIKPSDISALKHRNFHASQDKVKVIAPVADIIRENFGKLPMAIGTGGFKETVIRSLEITGMRKYFDHIITADDVLKHKPDPETFTKCANLMQIEPELILVFEDGDLGIEAAEKGGMTAIDVRGWYDYNW